MLQKSLILLGTAFLIVQVTSFSTKGSPKSLLREYVTINGTEYYIDNFGVSRDEAKADCDSRNMTLLAFDEPNEWENARVWLLFNGYDWDWFWTSAIRHVNSTTWIWESTGEEVTEFFWGADQPDITPGELETCLDFRVRNGGWDDDDCSIYLLGFICE
ncbi:uncharacterized protein LOC135936847 [Cloeon dipterum]|uniref:uncharacterized protein LOC135936847 n=1 Tax=Cloeon dipterum TaxID=197152 RepID=UPI0032207DD7